MSPAAAHAQSSPPGDEELAALYNQVLIGFAEESPTSEQSSFRLPSPGEREPEPAYNHFVDDGSNSRSMHSPSARPTPPGMCSSFVHRVLKHPSAVQYRHLLTLVPSASSHRPSCISCTTKKSSNTRHFLTNHRQTRQTTPSHSR